MCLCVILIVVVALITYPLFTSQDLIVATKRDKLVTRANFIASTLALSEYLSKDKVSLAMEIHTIAEGERIVVCDGSGLALYDSSTIGSTVDKYVLTPEIMSALSGLDSFHSRYQEQGFESRVSVPVMFEDTVLGAVYLYETDSAQAAILKGLRAKMQGLSCVLGIALLLLIIAFSSTLTRRLHTLLDGIRNMRDGAYGSTVSPKGHDELTEIFDEFNNMSKRLQDTEELRRTFVSDASHELRTPLSSIRLLTDSILQTENIDIDTAREFIRDIGDEIDRLTRIAEKLLILTKLDGAKELTLDMVNLTEVVEQTLNMLGPLAEESQIELRRDLTEDVRILADADGAKIKGFTYFDLSQPFSRGYI